MKKNYLVLLLVSILVLSCSGINIKMPSNAMLPTFQSGDNLRFLLFNKVKRGGIYLLDLGRLDFDNSKLYSVFRIIGLPGDKIKIKGNILFVNNKEYDLGVFYNNKNNYQIINDPNYFIDQETKYFTSELIEQGIRLSEDEYFYIGDNAGNSNDSRYNGLINKSQIIGKIE